MRPNQLDLHGHFRKAVHLQQSGLDHPALEIRATDKLARGYAKQVAEAIYGELFDASLQPRAKLDQLVERHRVFAGHYADDFRLDPSPAIGPCQHGP